MKLAVETYWHGDEVKVKAKNTVYKSVLHAATVVQSNAVMMCPVDYGNLRGSITIKYNREDGEQTVRNQFSDKHNDGSDIEMPQEKGVAHVGTAVNYAEYVEFGLKSKPAYPQQSFLRPAYDLASGQVLTIVNENGRAEFKEYLQKAK